MRINPVLDKLFCRDFAYKDGVLFFAAYNLNGIFCFNLKQKASELLTYIPDEIVMGGNGYYSGITLTGGRLFIAPDHAQSMLMYDIALKKLKQIQLPKTQVVYPSYSKFDSVITYMDRIFYIPCRFPGIIESDKQGENIRLYECDMLQDRNSLVVDACVLGDKVYLVLWNQETKETGNILVFHMDQHIFCTWRVCAEWEISAVCCIQNDLWMMTDQGLVKYDILKNEHKKYGMPAGWLQKKQTFKMTCFEDKIWIFTENGESFYTFDTLKEEYGLQECITDRVCHNYIVNNYIMAKVYDSKLFYFNASAGKLFVFYNGNRQEYEIKIPDEYDRDQMIQQGLETLEIFNEGKDLSIFGYIVELKDFLQNLNSDSNKQSIDCNYGKRIYEEIRKNV